MLNEGGRAVDPAVLNTDAADAADASNGLTGAEPLTDPSEVNIDASTDSSLIVFEAASSAVRTSNDSGVVSIPPSTLLSFSPSI